MPTIRDALEAEFDGVEEVAVAPAAQIDEPVIEASPAETAEQVDARTRDEAGRFAPKKPEASEIVPAQPVATEAKARPAAPSSWKPEKRAKWDLLDPEIAEYINQREEETNRGVEPLKKVWNEIQPFMPAIQEMGRTPEFVVGDLLKTAHALKTSDPQTKFQIWMNIGQAYGVPAHLLTNPGGQSQVDPQIAQLMNQVQQLQGTVGSFQHQQQLSAQQQTQSMIDEFAGTHPHFEEVRQTMGALMTQGIAPDLQSAYDKALRLNDDLWTQSQAQQRDASELARRQTADKAAKAARASAVSPRSATPGAAVATMTGANGRRALLEEGFNQAIAGRM